MIKGWNNCKENDFSEGSYVTGKVLIIHKCIPKSSVRIIGYSIATKSHSYD